MVHNYLWKNSTFYNILIAFCIAVWNNIGRFVLFFWVNYSFKTLATCSGAQFLCGLIHSQLDIKRHVFVTVCPKPFTDKQSQSDTSIHIYERIAWISVHTQGLIPRAIMVVTVTSIRKRCGRCELCLLWGRPTVMSSLKSWNLVMRHDHLSLRFLASSEKCKQNQIGFLQSDPVKTLEEMFALKLLWCEAWEAAYINSSDEPLRFPGIGADNSLLASDTLENITLWLETCKGMLRIKEGKTTEDLYTLWL